MEKIKFNKYSYGFLYNILENVIKRKISKNSFFRPILPSFFPTLRCNLQCSYCNVIKRKCDELSTAETCKIIEKIRPGVAAISVTGGEPLIKSNIIEIMEKCNQLKFAPVFLNTSALLLHKKDKVLNYVDYLIISLDTLDQDKFDEILGVEGAAFKIIKNIQKYAQYQQKNLFRIIINPVITNYNIQDIYDIIKFCEENNVMVSPVPEHGEIHPNSGLNNNEEYHKLMIDIIEMKLQGKNHIILSEIYLRQILKFEKHNCFPTLVPRIYPDGSVFYPCSRMSIYGNLLDYPNLKLMLKEAHRKEGFPACSFNSKECFMSCYLEPTNIIEYPLETIKEQLRNIH